MTVNDMIAEARSRIRNLTPDEVSAELDRTDTILIDVREPGESDEDGAIPGALSVPRGMLEFHADPTSPYHLDRLQPDAHVIVYCKSGGRSALAAAALQDLGYSDVGHLDGGIVAWKAGGRPVSSPDR